MRVDFSGLPSATVTTRPATAHGADAGSCPGWLLEGAGFCPKKNEAAKTGAGTTKLLRIGNLLMPGATRGSPGRNYIPVVRLRQQSSGWSCRSWPCDRPQFVPPSERQVKK